MTRIVVINTCDECPHFDNEYYDYEHTCRLLDRQHKTSEQNPNYTYIIHDDCPLDDIQDREKQ